MRFERLRILNECTPQGSSTYSTHELLTHLDCAYKIIVSSVVEFWKIFKLISNYGARYSAISSAHLPFTVIFFFMISLYHWKIFALVNIMVLL